MVPMRYLVHMLVLLALTRSKFATSFSTRETTTISLEKQVFLNALDHTASLNDATSDTTKLLANLCIVNPTSKPGSVPAFQSKAIGEWRVVYAPHMSTMGRVLRSKFYPVVYKLYSDHTITSHARVEVPVLGAFWLSVSGTYDSHDGARKCRVTFDEAWFRSIDADADADDAVPYQSITDVPDSPLKEIIRKMGRAVFIDQFAIFPVSYLDDDLIVFDFELFGTRICALKQ